MSTANPAACEQKARHEAGKVELRCQECIGTKITVQPQ